MPTCQIVEISAEATADRHPDPAEENHAGRSASNPLPEK